MLRSDTQLHNAMRIVSGTVKSTPTEWLPVLTNILPPPLRRKEALLRSAIKAEKTKRSLLYQMLRNTPKYLTTEWHENWTLTDVKNSCLVSDPNKGVEGMDLLRDVWSVLNRIRTGHGRCSSMMSKWSLKDSSACDCGYNNQTVHHIVEECPKRRFNRGIEGIHTAGADPDQDNGGGDF
ncbi:Uncharacterized protein FWK35_00015383 [Aphis craccivora]|uniref:Reverse transcriptase domain-containing protein n=1 Tax=Aphis craccivora TaxID=307492 RepID=A0A6G0YMF1_APHCR|nr:Uncharacterized protein FWK35_00015383 [Aphis craccivora]